MSVFDDVVMAWKGTEYTVPAERVMRLIAKIEDTITLHEVHEYTQRGTAPLGKMAIAYADALRFAGCNVKDDEVYSVLMSGVDESHGAQQVLLSLLAMMVPPQDLDVKQGPKQSGKSQAASKPSKPRSSRRSG